MADKENNDTKQEDLDAFVRYAKLAKQYLRPPGSYRNYNKVYTKFNKDRILEILNQPELREDELREASIYLYNISSHYRRLINYYAKMGTYNWYLVPTKVYTSSKVNKKSFVTAYKKAVEQCELMNLRVECIKIAETCFLEDIFYGYEYETKDSYYIQKLPPKYCRIVAVEDGIYTFEFDFGYFDSRSELLDYYGTEFRMKYELYRTDKTKHRWQELNSKNSVCIKLNSSTMAIIPPFAGTFPDIYDIADYKELTKSKTETGNYKLINMKIPFENGNFKIPMPMATSFYEQIAPEIPESIGFSMSPMDMSVLNFEKSGSTQDTDAVVQSENNFWAAAGTSNAILGNPDVTSSSAIALSIEADAAIVYSLMDQIARWINKKLKQLPGTIHFKLNFLHQTIYNQKDVQNQLLTAAQYSFPVKCAAAAAFGISSSDFEGLLVLENQIMDLQEKMVPVASTHTQSSSDTTSSVGRPTQDTTDVSGEKTEVHESNDR